MPVFMGRNASGVPTFAIGSNDSTLHNYPPDSSLVFRSDLPYILADEYTVSAYSDVASSIGTVRYFTLPDVVINSRNNLQVVLFYFINGSTIVPCTPQYSASTWYGSMWGWTNLSGSYINKNFAFYNPSFVSPDGSNWSSSSVAKGASSPTLTANSPVLLRYTDTKIGFPLLTSGFTPLQLRCVVLKNLKYTSTTDPTLIHSKNSVTTSDGVKISKTEFKVGSIDFRSQKLLVYSNNSAGKPTNSAAVSDISSNIVTKYPGISCYTSDKLFSVARDEYRADSSGDKVRHLTPSQYNILSGIRDTGSSIIGAVSWNAFRTSTVPTVSDFKTPVFGIMEPSSSTASVEIDSRTSTVKLGGAVFLSPSITPLCLISASKQFSYSGGIFSKTFTSGQSLLTEILVGSMPNVFNSKGCGILTVNSTTQNDYNHNTYIANTDGSSFFNVKSSTMITTDFSTLHSSLVQLDDGEKITLFTIAYNTADLAPYVGATEGGLSFNVFLKRAGSSLDIYVRYDDGGSDFSLTSSYGSRFYFKTNINIPPFSFSFTELQ